MKKALILLIFLLVCVGGAWLFFSLSRLPTLQGSDMRLRVERGFVELKRGQDTIWTRIDSEQILASGDRVRTGAESGATISIFDAGESRLAANTEVIIQEARQDKINGTSLAVHVRISRGRIWSRLLRLFDLKSSFSVGTQTVVATVRGTAFDLQTDEKGTVLSVTDAAVDVSGSNGAAARQKIQPVIVSRGLSARFDATGKLVASEPVSDILQQSEWFVQNTERDTAFVRRAHEQIVARLTALHPVSPDSAWNGLTRLSERLRLTTDPEHAAQIYAQYVSRRLFAMTKLIDAGKSGLAFQAFSVLGEDIQMRFKGKDGAQYRRAVSGSLQELLRFLEPIDPSSAAYRLKQRIEDLYRETQSADTADAAGAAALLYARLIALETQLIAAERFLTRVDVDQLQEVLDVTRQGLATAERDIDRLPNTVPTNDANSLRVKLFVLKAREADIRSRFAARIQASQATSTSAVPSAGAATSTEPLLPPTTPPSASLPQRSPTPSQATSAPAAQPTPSASLSPLQNLTVVAQPNPVQPGELVRLLVTGRRVDGTESDVTARARFEQFGALGSLNGPTYQSAQAGSITIQATVMERGTPLTGRVTLQIQNKPVTLNALEILPIGSNVVGLGGRAVLRARAIYSDGSTKDVTQSTSFRLSDSQAGSLVGNVFQAGQTLSTARITGAYTEGGVNVTGSTEISIGLEVQQ